MSRGSRRAPTSLACKHRPIRYESKLPTSCLFFSHHGPNVSRDGYDVARLEQHSGLCLPAIWHDPTGPGQPQAECQCYHHPNCALLVPEPLVEVPVRLSSKKDHLRQPHFHRFHRNLHVLCLTAWRLSSNPPSTSTCLREWLDSLPDVAAAPLE